MGARGILEAILPESELVAYELSRCKDSITIPIPI